MGSSGRYALVVEGHDDKFLINALLCANGFKRPTSGLFGTTSHSEDTPPPFVLVRDEWERDTALQIHVAQGFPEIKTTVKTLINPDSIRALAIVADMDLHDDNRWSSIQSWLRERGFSKVPASVPSAGLVHAEPGLPVLGVWLMPDNLSEGMAETFAGQLVPADDEGWQHATNVVTGLPDTVRRFRPDRDHHKALLHTWLAWQEEPGCKTGEAVKKGLLVAQAPPAQAFVGWIDRWLAESGK